MENVNLQLNRYSNYRKIKYIYICTIYSCFLISRCIRMCVCVCRSDGSFSREEDYTTYRSNGCYANICTVLKHDSVIFIPSIFSVFTIHSRNGIHVHLAQGSIYVGYRVFIDESRKRTWFRNFRKYIWRVRVWIFEYFSDYLKLSRLKDCCVTTMYTKDWWEKRCCIFQEKNINP